MASFVTDLGSRIWNFAVHDYIFPEDDFVTVCRKSIALCEGFVFLWGAVGIYYVNLAAHTDTSAPEYIPLTLLGANTVFWGFGVALPPLIYARVTKTAPEFVINYLLWGTFVCIMLVDCVATFYPVQLPILLQACLAIVGQVSSAKYLVIVVFVVLILNTIRDSFDINMRIRNAYEGGQSDRFIWRTAQWLVALIFPSVLYGVLVEQRNLAEASDASITLAQDVAKLLLSYNTEEVRRVLSKAMAAREREERKRLIREGKIVVKNNNNITTTSSSLEKNKNKNRTESKSDNGGDEDNDGADDDDDSDMITVRDGEEPDEIVVIEEVDVDNDNEKNNNNNVSSGDESQQTKVTFTKKRIKKKPGYRKTRKNIPPQLIEAFRQIAENLDIYRPHLPAYVIAQTEFMALSDEDVNRQQNNNNNNNADNNNGQGYSQYLKAQQQLPNENSGSAENINNRASTSTLPPSADPCAAFSRSSQSNQCLFEEKRIVKTDPITGKKKIYTRKIFRPTSDGGTGRSANDSDNEGDNFSDRSSNASTVSMKSASSAKSNSSRTSASQKAAGQTNSRATGNSFDYHVKSLQNNNKDKKNNNKDNKNLAAKDVLSSLSEEEYLRVYGLDPPSYLLLLDDERENSNNYNNNSFNYALASFGAKQGDESSKKGTDEKAKKNGDTFSNRSIPGKNLENVPHQQSAFSAKLSSSRQDVKEQLAAQQKLHSYFHNQPQSQQLVQLGANSVLSKSSMMIISNDNNYHDALEHSAERVRIKKMLISETKQRDDNHFINSKTDSKFMISTARRRSLLQNINDDAKNETNEHREKKTRMVNNYFLHGGNFYFMGGQLLDKVVVARLSFTSLPMFIISKVCAFSTIKKRRGAMAFTSCGFNDNGASLGSSKPEHPTNGQKEEEKEAKENSKINNSNNHNSHKNQKQHLQLQQQIVEDMFELDQFRALASKKTSVRFNKMIDLILNLAEKEKGTVHSVIADSLVITFNATERVLTANANLENDSKENSCDLHACRFLNKIEPLIRNDLQNFAQDITVETREFINLQQKRKPKTSPSKKPPHENSKSKSQNDVAVEVNSSNENNNNNNGKNNFGPQRFIRNSAANSPSSSVAVKRGDKPDRFLEEPTISQQQQQQQQQEEKFENDRDLSENGDEDEDYDDGGHPETLDTMRSECAMSASRKLGSASSHQQQQYLRNGGNKNSKPGRTNNHHHQPTAGSSSSLITNAIPLRDILDSSPLFCGAAASGAAWTQFCGGSTRKQQFILSAFSRMETLSKAIQTAEQGRFIVVCNKIRENAEAEFNFCGCDVVVMRKNNVLLGNQILDKTATPLPVFWSENVTERHLEEKVRQLRRDRKQEEEYERDSDSSQQQNDDGDDDDDRDHVDEKDRSTPVLGKVESNNNNHNNYNDKKSRNWNSVQQQQQQQPKNFIVDDLIHSPKNPGANDSVSASLQPDIFASINNKNNEKSNDFSQSNCNNNDDEQQHDNSKLRNDDNNNDFLSGSQMDSASAINESKSKNHLSGSQRNGNHDCGFFIEPLYELVSRKSVHHVNSSLPVANNIKQEKDGWMFNLNNNNNDGDDDGVSERPRPFAQQKRETLKPEDGEVLEIAQQNNNSGVVADAKPKFASCDYTRSTANATPHENNINNNNNNTNTTDMVDNNTTLQYSTVGAGAAQTAGGFVLPGQSSNSNNNKLKNNNNKNSGNFNSIDDVNKDNRNNKEVVRAVAFLNEVIQVANNDTVTHSSEKEDQHQQEQQQHKLPSSSSIVPTHTLTAISVEDMKNNQDNINNKLINNVTSELFNLPQRQQLIMFDDCSSSLNDVVAALSRGDLQTARQLLENVRREDPTVSRLPAFKTLEGAFAVVSRI